MNDLPPYVRKKTAKGLTYYYLARGEQLIRLPDVADPLFPQKLRDLYGGTPPTRKLRREIRPRGMPTMPCQVYFIGADDGPIKIGKSCDPRARCKAMITGSPNELRVLATVLGDGALEKAYHRRFGFAHLRGEWFERHPEIEAEIARLNAGTKEAHMETCENSGKLGSENG